MKEKKAPLLFRGLKAAVKVVYPKIRTEGTENLPGEPCLIVGNHAQLHGPIACELHFPIPRYTWCIAQMMNRKELPAYAYEDFWSKKPGSVRWLFKIVAHLMARPAAYILRNGNTIGVYHDHRVITTFRETLRVLQDGHSVVIFPECYDKHNPIVYQFQEGFVDVARLYYKKTGKELQFVPLYVAPKLHKMVLGKPIAYCSENPAAEERKRVCTYLMDAITELAVSQPEHIVVPYPNLPKKEYPRNVLPKE